MAKIRRSKRKSIERSASVAVREWLRSAWGNTKWLAKTVNVFLTFITIVVLAKDCYFDQPCKKKDLSEIVELINTQQRANHLSLRLKYPEGYAVFYADFEEKVLYSPISADSLSSLTVYWNTCELVDYSRQEDRVTIRVGKMMERSMGSEMYDMTLTVQSDVGQQVTPFFFGKEALTIEILLWTDSGVICVLGLESFSS